MTISTASLIRDMPTPTPPCEVANTETYDASQYGGLSRSEWRVPSGLLWEDGILRLEFNDRLSEFPQPDVPYQIFVADTGESLLSANRHSMLALWAGVRRACDEAFSQEFCCSNDFSVAGNHQAVEITYGSYAKRGLTRRGNYLRNESGVSVSGKAVSSLLACLDTAATHFCNHYWRVEYRGGMNIWSKELAGRVRSNNGARIEYLSSVQQAVRAA